jgi:predicted ATPase
VTQPLRIYVCGAHSTGKTTLARHLARELGLPLINEVARQVMAELEISFESLRVNLEQVASYQKQVFQRQMEVEERYPDGFVSDRTFCNLAYAARHSLILPDLLDHKAERYFERVRNESLVFFVRPHMECMANDGVRERVGWDEINRIDGILDFILGWQRIPCVGISELNMKDRVRTAMTALRLYQRSRAAQPIQAPGNGNGNGNGHHHADPVDAAVSWTEARGY